MWNNSKEYLIYLLIIKISVLEFMKILYNFLLLTLLFGSLLLTTNAQTPDDDEVEVPIPNYNHKYYSGMTSSYNRLSGYQLLRK